VKPVEGVRLEGVDGSYVWETAILIYGIWGLAAAVVVRRPVAWLYSDTINTEGTRTPQGLLWFERVTLGAVLATTGCLATDAFFFATRWAEGGVAWVVFTVIVGVLGASIYYSITGFASERPVRATK
jgi:hypothetical protein